MIESFIKSWYDRKHLVEEQFRKELPHSYEDIVKAVVPILKVDEKTYGEDPDPERICEIDHGHYQGTLVYVIAEQGYQPSTYWAVTVSYGSCSGCDTLDGILSDYTLDEDEQINQLMTLALHIVQELKEIS